MDAMLRYMQKGAQETAALRTYTLPMRLGVVTQVAKIIEYYVPESFRKKAAWIPADQRGKVIPFPSTEKKSA